MKVSVLVPTYRRPADITRCLRALAAQRHAPDEVIVLVRTDDAATHACLADSTVRGALALRIVALESVGQVAALNRGLDEVGGDIVAITDDDAAPRADWLQRIVCAFMADSRLGALGGRDWVYQEGRVLDESRVRVGRLALSGKIIGNHHLGIGGAREVDMLKGANMSYRRTAIERLRFDSRLRGMGAQVHNDMAFSMGVKRAGWKLIYDPAVAVDHYPAERFDEDGRAAASLTAVSNAAFNLHLILHEYLPLHRRTIAWWWYMFIGTRVYPGLAHVVLSFLSPDGVFLREHWRAVRHGAYEAKRNSCSNRAMLTP